MEAHTLQTTLLLIQYLNIDHRVIATILRIFPHSFQWNVGICFLCFTSLIGRLQTPDCQILQRFICLTAAAD